MGKYFNELEEPKQLLLVVPDMERKRIKNYIQGEHWPGYGPLFDIDEAGSKSGRIDPWVPIKPVNAKENYLTSEYDKFFQKWAFRAFTKGELNGYLFILDAYKDSGDTALYNKAFAKFEEFNTLFSDQDMTDVNKASAAQRAHYELLGILTGIPAKYIPTTALKQIDAEHDKHWHGGWLSFGHDPYQIFRDWHHSEYIEDMQDTLLALYLEEPNARRDKNVALAHDLDEADIEELAAKDWKDAATPEEALKIKSAQAIKSATDRGQKLGTDEASALSALTGPNSQTYFSARLRRNAQSILKINLDSFQNPWLYTTDKSGAKFARIARYHKSVYQDWASSATSINKLAYDPSSGPFINIMTHEASQLVPMVRLYKTYYDEKTNDISKEVELYFDGGVPSDSQGNPLRDRSGVGIKSFDWRLNATNPATVRNDIEATLVLYFQNFNDLIRSRTGYDVITGRAERFKYEDLLLRPPSKKDAPPKVSSPGRSAGGQCSRENSIYDPRFYEIKAICGWAPQSKIEAQKTPGLVTAIKNQQLPMFLTLIDHEFSFTQEGTFELSITYRARLEAIGSDPRLDVLTTPDVKLEVSKIQKEIKQIRDQCGSNEIIDELRKDILRARERDKDNFSESIIQGLEDRIYFSLVDSSDVYEATAGFGSARDKREAAKDIANGLKITEKAVLRSIANKNETLKEEVRANMRERIVDSTHPALEDSKEKNTEGNEQTEEGSASESGFVKTDFASQLAIPWFYFGDLVNVVATNAMDTNYPNDESSEGYISSLELENLIYLLGTFDYRLTGKVDEDKVGLLSAIPIAVETFNQWYIKTIVNSNRESMSLLEFMRSFIQAVVVPALNNNAFNDPDFIAGWRYGSFGQLEEEVPGVPGYNKEGIIYRPWVDIAPVSLKTAAISLPSEKKQGLDALTAANKLGPNPLEKFRIWPKNKDLPAVVVDLDKFDPSKKILTKRTNTHDQTLKNSYHVNVFYLIGQDAYKVLGKPPPAVDTYSFTGKGKKGEIDSYDRWYASREQRDYRQGIFHLYLGADRGIVKEVSFSKVDAPYLREARIQQDALNPLALLAATYNVTLKLIGNTIFWPGQYIYVNPVGYGSELGQPDDPGSVSNQLGLGGYHLVTNVKSYIESGRYETEVKALFEFSGDGCPSLPQSTQPACDGEGSPGAAVEIDSPPTSTP